MEDTEQTENLSFPTHHLHNPEDLDSSSHHCPKRQKKNKSQNTHKGKKVQWSDLEPMYTNQVYPGNFPTNHMLQPPAFQPAYF